MGLSISLCIKKFKQWSLTFQSQKHLLYWCPHIAIYYNTKCSLKVYILLPFVWLATPQALPYLLLCLTLSNSATWKGTVTVNQRKTTIKEPKSHHPPWKHHRVESRCKKSVCCSYHLHSVFSIPYKYLSFASLSNKTIKEKISDLVISWPCFVL